MGSIYFDLPENYSSYDKAAAVILPVPLEATTSYVKGTFKAPAAILKASFQVELYDEELSCEPCEAGIATLPPVKVEGMPLEKALNEIQSAVTVIFDACKLPVMIGGEHSVTPPAVAAAAKVYDNLTVIQLDAHADLREEYGGTKWSHACAMARVREICPAVQVGIRNLSKEEAARVAKEKLPVFFAHKIKQNAKWVEDVMASVRTRNVYVTFDVDAFDSSILPDTGTPEPGGLSWYEVLSLMKAVSEKKNIVGFDFVELSPREGHHASDFTVAKLIYKCIGYWAAARNTEARGQK
jgi:agmatinase